MVSTVTALHFPALTLFESTLMNAGMLLDGMSMDDLLGAMRLTSNLHLQLVAAAELQRRLQAVSEEEAAAAEAEEAGLDSVVDVDDEGEGVNEEDADAEEFVDEDGRLPRLVKADGEGDGDNVVGAAADSSSTPPPDMSPNPTATATAMLDDEDDQMEEDGLPGSLLMGNMMGIASPEQRLTVGGTSHARSVLKESYKFIRGSGPHLFDFSKPWQDPANQVVAQKVAAHAQNSSGLDSTDADVWRSACFQEFRSMQTFCLRNRPVWRKGKRQKAKLGRRQKAFEALLSNLTPEELEQYRVVLTRDLTSSDEEEEDETLRIRDLPWQSERVRLMKRRLDEAFLLRFATVKQRSQLVRCLRDPKALSGRAAPVDIPDWALISDAAKSGSGE